MSTAASFPPLRWLSSRIATRLRNLMRAELEAARTETYADREQSLSSLRLYLRGQIEQSVSGAQAALSEDLARLEQRIAALGLLEQLGHRNEAAVAGLSRKLDALALALAQESEDLRAGLDRHLEALHGAVQGGDDSLAGRIDAIGGAVEAMGQHAERDRSRIEARSQDLAALRELVGGLTPRLTDISAQGAAVRERVSDLAGRLTRTHARIEQLDGDIQQRVLDALGGPITGIAERAVDLQDRVSELAERAAGVHAFIDQLQTQAPQWVLNALGGPITGIAERAVDLQDRVSELAAQLADARVRSDHLAADLPQGVLGLLDPRLTALAERSTDIRAGIDRAAAETPSGVLNVLGGPITAIAESAADLQDKVAALTARLDEVVRRTEGLKADVESTSVQVESVNGQFPRLAEQLGLRLIRLSDQVAQLGPAASATNGADARRAEPGPPMAPPPKAAKAAP